MRALDAAGYSRSDIAAFLGISYQHVHSVLGPLPKPAQVYPRTPESQEMPTVGASTIDAGGRIELSEAVLAALGARRRAALPWKLEDGVLTLMGRHAGLRFAQDLVAKRSAGRGKSGTELLEEERRLDSAREEAREQRG